MDSAVIDLTLQLPDKWYGKYTYVWNSRSRNLGGKCKLPFL